MPTLPPVTAAARFLKSKASGVPCQHLLNPVKLWIDSLQTEGKLPQAWELCFLNLKMCLFRPSDTGCEFQVLGRLRQEDGKSKPYLDFETPSQN